jgi:hypothetical protein
MPLSEFNNRRRRFRSVSSSVMVSMTLEVAVDAASEVVDLLDSCGWKGSECDLSTDLQVITLECSV